MVEQTRRPRRIVSLLAGPGEVGTDALLDMNLRYNNNNNNNNLHLQATDPVGSTGAKIKHP